MGDGGFADFLGTVDCLVMGRHTLEKVASSNLSPEEWPYNDLPVYVLSKTLSTLLVINLWVSYSSMAVCIRLVPKPMDAFMVFGSIMGLYILNFMITRPAYEFFYVHGVFNLGAALATFYNVHRGLSDDTIDYDPALFRPVYALNVAIFILSMAVGLVLHLHLVGQVQEALLASMVLICPPAWLWVFWVNFKQAFPVFAQ
ncbi:MAG: hypothetical protein HRT76_05810 [Halieaceae bacterium]|nr:hypothetical protein [Halieaceae bacterium]